MSEVVVVVAAHPDDEVLGCGGTIARRAAAGDEVHIVILGEGITSRFANASQAKSDELVALQGTAREVAKMLGARSINFGGLADNRFDSLHLLDVIKLVEGRLADFQPSAVYTHHPGDLNKDHRITFQAVLTATRPMSPRAAADVYTFEILSSTEWAFQQFAPAFKANVFHDVESTIDVKVRCLEAYTGEVRQFPHPRSGEAVRVSARRWGSVVGVEYAEAFELVRSVRR